MQNRDLPTSTARTPIDGEWRRHRIGSPSTLSSGKLNDAVKNFTGKGGGVGAPVERINDCVRANCGALQYAQAFSLNRLDVKLGNAFLELAFELAEYRWGAVHTVAPLALKRNTLNGFVGHRVFLCDVT